VANVNVPFQRSMSSDITVNKTTRNSLDGWIPFSVEPEIVPFQSICGVYPASVKRENRGADHSSLCSADIPNAWGFIFASLTISGVDLCHTD
jgi:hypothetical protein